MPPATRHHAVTKTLALLCILIAVAPLSSIYHLFTTSKYDKYRFSSVAFPSDSESSSSCDDETGDCGNAQSSPSSSSSSSSFSSIGAILQSENVDVEDVVQYLFKNAMNYGAPGPYGSFLFLGLGNGGSFIRMNQFTMVLPWCISMIMGIIVPSILSIISYIQSRRRRGRIHNNGQSDEERFFAQMNRREKRLSRLVLCIRHFKKVLKDTDFITCTNDQEEEEPSEKTEVVMLPSPGMRCTCTQENNTQREIPGTCAVCLAQYKSGDTVVWSSNAECQHVFHETCIVSWLMRKRDQLCPCCRQQFINPKLDVSDVCSYIETEQNE